VYKEMKKTITITLGELKELVAKQEQMINTGCDLMEKEAGIEIPQEKRLLMNTTLYIEKVNGEYKLA
jgi:hypothetical protein